MYETSSYILGISPLSDVSTADIIWSEACLFLFLFFIFGHIVWPVGS